MTAHPIPDWPTTPLDTPTASGEVQLYGVIAGAAVPALLASAAAWLDVTWLLAIAGAGIPIGAVLGAEGAARMTGPHWVVGAFRAGVIAPILAGLGVAAFFAVGGLASGASSGLYRGDAIEAIVGGLGGAAASAIIFGAIAVMAALVIALPITVPAAFVAALVLRWAASLDRPVARFVMTALAVVASLLGVLILATHDLPW